MRDLEEEEDPLGKSDARRYSEAFHVSTYTFDLRTDFPEVIEAGYSLGVLEQKVDLIEKNPERYLYGIDRYSSNALVPQNRCTSPCMTCRSDEPSVCESCLGLVHGNKKSFLSNGECLEECPAEWRADAALFYSDATHTVLDHVLTYYQCTEVA